MINTSKIKILFLIALSTLFCYRAALLSVREYNAMHERADMDFLSQDDQDTLFIITLLRDVGTDKAATPHAQAAQVEQVAEKLNTQLKHHGYMVERMLSNNKYEEKDLQRIEREIALLEQTAKKLGISQLLDHALITDIKKSMVLLRMQVSMLGNTSRG